MSKQTTNWTRDRAFAQGADGRCVLWMLMGVLALLTGCESYAIRGTVVEGPMQQVLIVDKDDPRLSKQVLKQARVDVTIDPRAMRPKPQPAVTTGDDGRFEVPISEGGAGFLEYSALMVIQHEGHVHVEHVMKLPGGGKRVLIVMKPGHDMYRPEGNILEETIREGQRNNMLPRN